MGQTLTHGIYLPDEGERNCYNGLAANWSILDGAVGTVAEHTSQIAGKAPLVHTHTKADVTDLLNSNFIPSANNSYDLGSSSYQWNNLYAKNYYYNGVAWGLDKANTWSENNTFSKPVSPSDITGIDSNTMAFTALRSVIFFNTTGSSNRQSYGTFLYSGYMAGSKPDNYGQLQLLRSTDKKGETNNGLIPDTTFRMWRVAPHYLLMDFMENARVTNDGTENSLKPITTGVTDLGTSTNKWKTLNGTNPGALSLPDMGTTADVNYFDFISTITHLDGTDNFYTPTVDGWMTVIIKGTALSLFEDASSGNNHNQGSGVSAAPINGYCLATIPVHKGKRVKIQATGTSIHMAQVRPCQGNV